MARTLLGFELTLGHMQNILNSSDPIYMVMLGSEPLGVCSLSSWLGAVSRLVAQCSSRLHRKCLVEDRVIAEMVLLQEKT